MNIALAIFFISQYAIAGIVPLPPDSERAIESNFSELSQAISRESLRNGGTANQDVKFSSSIQVNGNAVYKSSVNLSQAYMVGGGLWRQYVSSTTTGAHILVEAIPNDTSIPQITEGSQILVATITPVNANSKIIIRGNINLDEYANNCNTGALCLFKGTTANALACFSFYTVGSPAYSSVPFTYTESATNTTLRNYSLRAGCETANSIRVNAQNNSILYGGTLTSVLELIEIEGR